MPRKYSLDLTNIKTDSHEKFYWLGFIAGDGNIAKKEARLRIELKEEDKEHLINFNKFMGSNSPLVERINNQGCKCVCLSINSIELKRYLAQYNLVPAKSKIFTIPLDKIPQQYLFDFLRGLFDADGCLTFERQRYDRPALYMVSGNLECIEQIKKIFQWDTKITTYKNSKNEISGYQLHKSEKQEVLRILDLMYQNSTENSRLKRKYEKRSLIE